MVWFDKIGVLFRRHSRLFVGTGILSVVGVCLCPQTFGLPFYKRMMAHYKDGVILPADSETQQLIEQVCLIFC